MREPRARGEASAAAVANERPRQRKRKDDTQAAEEDSDADGDTDDEIAGAGAIGEEIIDAVVKVYCTHTEPNWSLPWQRKRQMASTSSGFIISGAVFLPLFHVAQ